MTCQYQTCVEKEHCWGYSGSLNIYVCWQIWWQASSASSSDFIAAAQCIQPHGIHIRIHTYAWDVLRRWEKDVDTVIRTAGNTGHGAEQHNMASRSPTEKKKNTYKSLHKTKHFEESCNTKLILILRTLFFSEMIQVGMCPLTSRKCITYVVLVTVCMHSKQDN